MLDDHLTRPSRTVLREVAHMLRSPLGAITLLTDTLRDQRNTLTPEQLEKPLGIIYRAALGVASTAGDLLTLTDGEADEPSVEEIAPAAALEVVADIVRPIVESLGGELEATARGAPFSGPARAVRRAMLGIALRTALRARGGELELAATSDEAGAFTFSATARGEMAPPEGGAGELLEIFRPDRDTDTYTLSSEGLGLAAVQRITESMGTDLEIDAETEGAIRLSFRLPGDRQPRRSRDHRD
jgi:signal transduction histidine kinase